MKQDNNLMRELLIMLNTLEESMPIGASMALFQPYYEDLHNSDGIKIDGYNGQQIDFHLRLLIEERYIDAQEAAMGISFNHLTQAGHAFLEIKTASSGKKSDIFILKPSFMGVGVDLKEAYQCFLKCRGKSS
jgi:hypothetical protein